MILEINFEIKEDQLELFDTHTLFPVLEEQIIFDSSSMLNSSKTKESVQVNDENFYERKNSRLQIW
jgi:hypothetical protein